MLSVPTAAPASDSYMGSAITMVTMVVPFYYHWFWKMKLGGLALLVASVKIDWWQLHMVSVEPRCFCSFM